MIDDFIERKCGRRAVQYDLPELKELLEETYGVIVYQEQVMQISNRLAGYSLGDADLLRRAMGKKKPEEMAKQRERFLQGATARGFPPKKVEKIFDLMEQFAGYGFNKSHSTAYAAIAYQTAYLKAHYPVEFMAALLTCGMEDTDRICEHVDDCRRMKIRVLPPDVNQSVVEFGVAGDGPELRLVQLMVAAQQHQHRLAVRHQHQALHLRRFGQADELRHFRHGLASGRVNLFG